MGIIFIAAIVFGCLWLIIWLIKEWIKGIHIIKQYNRMKIEKTLIDADEYKLDQEKVEKELMTENEFRMKWRTK